MTTTALSDATLKSDFLEAVRLGNEDAMIEAENNILARLDVSLDESEMGLTANAVAQIERFVGGGWSYANS